MFCCQSKLDDDSLRALFIKYAEMDQDNGPSGQSEKNEAHPLESSIMNLESFAAFLKSSDNAVLLDQNKAVYHDMTRPISEYFISSSHNTYLIGILFCLFLVQDNFIVNPRKSVSWGIHH